MAEGVPQEVKQARTLHLEKTMTEGKNDCDIWN